MLQDIYHITTIIQRQKLQKDSTQQDILPLGVMAMHFLTMFLSLKKTCFVSKYIEFV